MSRQNCPSANTPIFSIIEKKCLNFLVRVWHCCARLYNAYSINYEFIERKGFMSNPMVRINAEQKFIRNEYGALCPTSKDLTLRINKFFEEAFYANKLTRPYEKGEWHRRHGFLGEVLNYDCYDINDESMLVQERLTSMSKYGASVISKDYYLVTKKDDKIFVKGAPKHLVVKLSKICPELGQVISIINEKNPILSAIALRDKSSVKL